MNLTIEGVGKRYKGDFWGLQDFTLELGPGVLGLLGPNGAGKSTLMRILATPLGRQLPAVWLSGVVLAVATGGVAALRLALNGDLAGLGAWTVGALFIPTMALALGVWSGSGKLFQILYLVLWYLGPMQRVPVLDYLGSIPAAVKEGVPLAYLVATGLLMVAAVAGRKRQLARL